MDLLKPFLWKIIHAMEDVHLGTSLRCRKLLQRVTYKEPSKIRDLQKFKVHICMAAYNAESWIGETIEAIQAQTIENWELCIVDDGSTDGTSEVVKEFIGNDTRIHLWQNLKNSGLNLTRNAGLDIAQKYFSWDVLAIVDADDIPNPDWLEKGLTGIEQGASVVRCVNTRCSPDLSIKYYDYMTCAQIFAKREIIQAVGYYRCQPFREDYDFMLRLEKASLISKSFVVTTPTAVQMMRLHDNNLSTIKKSTEQIACDLYSKRFSKAAKKIFDLYVEKRVSEYQLISSGKNNFS